MVARTCTCFCGVFLQHIPVPTGYERFVVVLLLLFVVVALTRIEADTMTRATNPGGPGVALLRVECLCGGAGLIEVTFFD